MEWKTIDSAPQREYVRVYDDFHKSMHVASSGMIDKDKFFDSDWNPVGASHWMPLPEAPKD